MIVAPGIVNAPIFPGLFEEMNSDDETETLEEETIFVDQNDVPQKINS